jgi:predicted nucleotidyltransferase
MSAGSPLTAIIQELETTGAPFALIGAAARNAWAPPRLTTDIDVAVAADEPIYQAVVAALARLGYRTAAAHRAEPEDDVPAVTLFRNEAAAPPYRQVDVLVAGTAFEREAIDRAVRMPLGDVSVPVVTREDLIVYKLIAWRPRDRQDIQDVIATARVAGAALDWERIREWADAWEVRARLDEVLAQPGD